MVISVINCTGSDIGEEELQDVIRAINRQIYEDFEPYWGMRASLRLENWVFDSIRSERQMRAELTGDVVMYICDTVPKKTMAFHEANAQGMPYGIVFTDAAAKVGVHWSLFLSHETLELIVDPEANLLVIGPHPEKPGVEVLHCYEICDPVQMEIYKIDGVEVSNFVLPLYFRNIHRAGLQRDFLGRTHPVTLKPFYVKPGGYLNFYDPATGDFTMFSLPDDKDAKKRLEALRALSHATRPGRYPNAVEQVMVKRKGKAARAR